MKELNSDSLALMTNTLAGLKSRKAAAILQFLIAEGEGRYVGEIHEALMPVLRTSPNAWQQSVCSSHLKILRKSHLVIAQRQGRQRSYRVNEEVYELLQDTLNRYRSIIESIDSLPF